MSAVFAKNKRKRSRSSSSEANNSFVKNMTSRMTGLLPSTITKWFSSPSSSNTNGSAPTAEATDSSTEDEAPDNTITQPPTKRMHFSSPSKYNHYSPNEANNVTNRIDTMDPCSSYDPVQSSPGRSTFRRETNFVPTPFRLPMEDSTIEKNDTDNTMFKSSHSVSNMGASVAPKRKSIFDSVSSKEASINACLKSSNNTIRDPNQPYFKPVLLGSPFYPGRTMYGGASTSYINQPNIKQRKTTFVNETNPNENNAISHSARRIMDLLEDYSSPLSEARRIPTYRPTQPNRTRSITTEKPYAIDEKPAGFKTQELNVPCIVSFLRLKRRSRLMDTTTAARQIMASHSSTSDYTSYPAMDSQRDQTDKNSHHKLTTKVKTKLTRTNRGNDTEAELPAPVNLPSATLQIDNDKLPKFSFGFPTTSSTPFHMSKVHSASKAPPLQTTQVEKPPNKPNNLDSLYKFSSPVRISREENQNATTPPKFSFGSPERSIDTPKQNEKKLDNVTSILSYPKGSNSLPSAKDWQCPDCWVSNKADVEKCVCCGCQKPSKTVAKNANQCSVCKIADAQVGTDKCGNCKVKENKPILFRSKPTAGSKWKCSDCWVENENNVDSCACCGGKKPDNTSEVSKIVVTNHKAEADWTCDDCWVKNKSTVDKCVACGGMKPSNKQKSDSVTKSAPAAVVPSLNNSFKDIVKSQAEKWECPNCLVSNSNDRIKCACCETDRKGAPPAPKPFNFGINNMFKFGIDPNTQDTKVTTQEKSSSILKDSFEAKTKPIESETNNNSLTNTPASRIPSFKFGVPSKVTEQTDSSEKHKDKREPSTKLSFSFSAPKEAVKPATTDNVATVPVMFGISNKSSEITTKATAEEKEKPQEVPKVDFTIPKPQERIRMSSNLFSSVQTPKLGQETSNFTPTPNASFSIEKKVATETPVVLPVSTTGSTTQTPSFTFSSTTKATNIFGSVTPATTAVNQSTSNITTISSVGGFSAPAQTVPSVLFGDSAPTTTGSSIPLLQNSGTSNKQASIFPKSATSTTAAPPSTKVGVSPIFSFGTKTQPTLPTQPENAKFNFAFSSNTKTETPPSFKNTFDATGSNKFSLSTPNNALGSGNATSLTGNVLGGNGITQNAVGTSGTDMSNNQLPSSNSLQSPPGGIFGAPAQKENIWSASNNPSNNLFVTNASSTNIQKPAFSFGASSFNPPNATPLFGNTAQPTANPFGQSNNSGNLFTSPVQNQTQNMFGVPQAPASNPASSLTMFGTPNVGATSTFGTSNPSIPSFEAPSLTPAAAPGFNFSTPPSNAVFGFGQQPGGVQQSGGVYSFGGAAAGAAGAGNAGGAAAPGGGPQVQFNMGSSPNTAMRRVRKAVRRNNR